MLPNWIIAGAPKSGTSSLFRWLVDHPEVDGSMVKETYYYSDPGTHMHVHDNSFHAGDVDGYEKLFAHCDPSARAIIESTPGYMYAQTALAHLPALPSQPNFIFVLREPVEQLKSLFSYFQNNWDWIPADMTFRAFIDEIDRGGASFKGNELAMHALENADYVAHLRRWVAACGPDRVHVFLFEDMISRKQEFMMALARRIGIDPSFYGDYGFPLENGSYAVRSRLLQAINMKLRSALPKGPAYEIARRLYRALNTAPAPGSRIVDTDIERELSCRYAHVADELTCEFGVDARGWKRKEAAAGPANTTVANAVPRPAARAM